MTNLPDIVARVRAASLSLRIMLALAGGLVAAIAFLEITWTVAQDKAGPFDLAVARWVHDLASPAGDAMMRGVSRLGDPPLLIAFVALLALWTLARRQRALAAVLVLVSVLAQGLSFLLKIALHRRRPDLFAGIVLPTTFSFPSGHALLSAAVYGMGALAVARLAPALRKPLAFLTPLLVLTIGWSRVYLGVHWPTDVLAGFAAGVLVFLGGAGALALLERRQKARPLNRSPSG